MNVLRRLRALAFGWAWHDPRELAEVHKIRPAVLGPQDSAATDSDRIALLAALDAQ